MSTKPNLCLICRKGVKSTNRLTRHLNAYKVHLYPKSQPLHKLPQHKSHKKVDGLGRNWKKESDLLGKTVTISIVNGIFETLTEDTPRKKLFANEFLLVLREEWFSSYEFPAGIFISDQKYKHLGSKHKNSFYPFNV